MSPNTQGEGRFCELVGWGEIWWAERRKESDADKNDEELRGGILVLCANLDFLSVEVSADTLLYPCKSVHVKSLQQTPVLQHFVTSLWYYVFMLWSFRR